MVALWLLFSQSVNMFNDAIVGPFYSGCERIGNPEVSSFLILLPTIWDSWGFKFFYIRSVASFFSSVCWSSYRSATLSSFFFFFFVSFSQFFSSFFSSSLSPFTSSFFSCSCSSCYFYCCYWTTHSTGSCLYRTILMFIIVFLSLCLVVEFM